MPPFRISLKISTKFGFRTLKLIEEESCLKNWQYGVAHCHAEIKCGAKCLVHNETIINDAELYAPKTLFNYLYLGIMSKLVWALMKDAPVGCDTK